jgi:hypothetical protein
MATIAAFCDGLLKEFDQCFVLHCSFGAYRGAELHCEIKAERKLRPIGETARGDRIKCEIAAARLYTLVERPPST